MLTLFIFSLITLVRNPAFALSLISTFCSHQQDGGGFVSKCNPDVCQTINILYGATLDNNILHLIFIIMQIKKTPGKHKLTPLEFFFQSGY